MSDLFTPNWILATPLPSAIFGRILNSGSIHDNLSSFLGSIRVTGEPNAAMLIVSIPVHAPHPSVEITAIILAFSTPSGSSTDSFNGILAV